MGLSTVKSVENEGFHVPFPDRIKLLVVCRPQDLGHNLCRKRCPWHRFEKLILARTSATLLWNVTWGSVAEFGVHFVQIDLANRHLVGRIVEVVFEQRKVPMIDFLHQVHGHVVKVVFDGMRALGAMPFGFVEPRYIGQIDRDGRADGVQHLAHSVVELLGPEDLVVAPAIHDEGADMT